MGEVRNVFDQNNFLNIFFFVQMDDDDEEAIADDETINQMIARSEAEFDKFRDMDKVRKREFRQARLIEEHELPKFLTESEIAEKSKALEESEAYFGKGARQRKEVDYSQDSWTDKQWLKALDEDVDDMTDEEEPVPTPKKKKGRKKKKTGDEEASHSGRGRKRLMADDDDDDDERSPSKKKRSAPPSSTQKSANVNKLQQLMNTLIEVVIQYKDGYVHENKIFSFHRILHSIGRFKVFQG